MKHVYKLAFAPVFPALAACATMAGASIGGGMGSISGNTGAGMTIGAGVGTMIEVID